MGNGDESTKEGYKFSGKGYLQTTGKDNYKKLGDFLGVDLISNPDLVAYGASASLPLYFHGTASTLLSNSPYFILNKGKKIKLTRVDSSDVSISEKYQIDIQDIK
jgi:hypothetical protein